MIIRPWDGFLPLDLPAIGPSSTTGGPMQATVEKVGSVPDERVGDDVQPYMTRFILTGLLTDGDAVRSSSLEEGDIELLQSLLFREQMRLGDMLGPGYTESDDEVLNLDADTYHEIIRIRKVLLAVSGTDDAVN